MATDDWSTTSPRSDDFSDDRDRIDQMKTEGPLHKKAATQSSPSTLNKSEFENGKSKRHKKHKKKHKSPKHKEKSSESVSQTERPSELQVEDTVVLLSLTPQNSRLGSETHKSASQNGHNDKEKGKSKTESQKPVLLQRNSYLFEAPDVSEDSEYGFNDRRVVLNVGGQRFETLSSTLMKYPESLLGTMFNPRNTHLLKSDTRGEFFFDRNPRAFEVILEFYRTGEFIPTENLPKRLLDKEIEFWQLSVVGKPPDDMEKLFSLIMSHVKNSTEEPPRDLIISRKSEHKHGDESLIVSELGWNFKVLGKQNIFVNSLQRKRDHISKAAFGCRTVIDKKIWLLCSRPLNQTVLLTRLRSLGIKVQLSQMTFDQCQIPQLPFSVRNNTPFQPRATRWERSDTV